MNQRLIDANALIEEMKDLMDNENEDDEWNKPLKFALKLIESAPTVETTDDVLSSLETLEKEMTLNYSNGEYSFKVIGLGYTSYARLPIEAVKKLEAALNNKHPTNEK